MKKRLIRFGLVAWLMAAWALQVLGDVTVTEPTGGNDISCDKSQNSTNGAGFTALGSIVIKENSNDDFGAGANQTLILTLPFGWRFNTAVTPTVSLQSGG